MLVTKSIEIDAGHRVPNHKSKCINFHGHRYKIELGIDDKVLTTPGASDEGMVIDFSHLKKVLEDQIDKVFDHSMIIYVFDEYITAWVDWQNRGLKVNIVQFIPTAENLAKYWYELMEPDLKSRGVKIKHVKVWETPTSTATYEAIN